MSTKAFTQRGPFPLFFLFFFLAISLNAQNNVGIGTDDPNAKAILELKSTNQGLLVPRMKTNQRNAIAPGASEEGLMVFDTDLDCFMFYSGGAWAEVGTGASKWNDNASGIDYTDGNVGIGDATPSYKLTIDNTDEIISTYQKNSYAGAGTKYGLYNLIDAGGTGSRYGIYNNITANASDNSTVYGHRNILHTNGSPANIYGLFTSVDSGGDGNHYGTYSAASGTNSYAFYGYSQYSAGGFAGYFDGKAAFVNGRVGIGTSTPSYKLHVTTDDESYGAVITNTNTGSGTLYGLYSSVSSTGTGTHYGIYSYAYGAGNRALYASNSHSTGYAGYFVGRGYFSKDILVSNKINIKPTGHAGGAEIEMFDNDGTQTLIIRANETTSSGGEILLYNDSGVKTIEIDAEVGTGGPGRIITNELQITGGADLAEHFDLLDDDDIVEPGMLVSIDPSSSGKLQISQTEYDNKIAGVISGANGVNPGMLMGQDGSIAAGEYPVALTGRVYVWVDTSFGAVRPGDMLTSSPRPGYAMKVSDFEKARGATVGKAMTALNSGTGYVLMLVNLQ